MAQLTLRVPDRLAAQLRARAGSREESVNHYATTVLAAAVDPDLATTEAERLRERLARAGLLAEAPPVRASQPSQEELETAREAAGAGTSLSQLIREGRR